MLARKTEFQGNIEAMGVNSHHPKILPSIFAHCGGFENVLKRPKKMLARGRRKRRYPRIVGQEGKQIGRTQNGRTYERISKLSITKHV